MRRVVTRDKPMCHFDDTKMQILCSLSLLMFMCFVNLRIPVILVLVTMYFFFLSTTHIKDFIDREETIASKKIQYAHEP